MPSLAQQAARSVFSQPVLESTVPFPREYREVATASTTVLLSPYSDAMTYPGNQPFRCDKCRCVLFSVSMSIFHSALGQSQVMDTLAAHITLYLAPSPNMNAVIHFRKCFFYSCKEVIISITGGIPVSYDVIEYFPYNLLELRAAKCLQVNVSHGILSKQQATNSWSLFWRVARICHK